MFEQRSAITEALAGRRHFRTPATQDCLECRFAMSFCGFGTCEVSAYRNLRSPLIRRSGTLEPL